MIISIFIIIALIAVIIGSYTDIKTLEVPDWLNYSLIAIGLGGNLIYSIATSDFSYILRSLLGLAVSIGIGMLMFYTGQWGGGDSKILFGLGALLGIDYNPFLLGFYLKFVINMLFAGALYGLAWIVFMAIKNRREISKKMKKAFKEKKATKIRLYAGIIAIIGLIIIYALPNLGPKMRILFSVFIIILYFMNYLFIFVKIVEEVSMIKLIEPQKLTEGDWIVNEIKIKGKYITGPKDLGISKEKIIELIKLKKQGKITKVKVKYGIPFVPSFLIALLYTIITNSVVVLQLI